MREVKRMATFGRFYSLALVVTVLLGPSCSEAHEARDDDVTKSLHLPTATRQLSASVNTRRTANIVDAAFISFYANPQDIFDGQGNPISETSFLMAQSLGQAYLKVVADSSQLHLQTAGGQSVIGGPDTGRLVHITASAWQAFYEWARRAELVPVFVLDYPSGSGGEWKPKSALQILSAASSLGINECRWQLGNGNVIDGAKYVEDLRTFRMMLKAFPKHRDHWSVVAGELNPEGVPLEELQYVHANMDTLVDAVTISKPIFYGPEDEGATWNHTTLLREINLRGLAGRHRVPIWLDLIAPRDADLYAVRSTSDCCGMCLREGLEYARFLGEAARGGVSAVFKSLHRHDIQQYTLSYVVALLHRRTIGRKVFSVQHRLTVGDRGSSTPCRTSVYAYCARNQTGSLTVVIVNEDSAGEAANVTINLQTRALTSPVELYLVNVQSGQAMVNNRAFDDANNPPVSPVTAVTSLMNGATFYVPAQSILYATLPGVQVRECRNDHPSDDREHLRSRSDDRTSADALLQDLIGDVVSNVPLEPLQRRRRWAGNDLMELPANGRQKRFPSRIAGPPQDSDPAESLAQANEETSPSGRSARGPRQTQGYKRQQRRLRQKEKRTEKRHLRKMKHPLRESLRERTKRGERANRPLNRQHQRLLKRMSAKLASPKTKRSSLAEAVNEPPAFVGSEETVDGPRSNFPLGDVHLVISKASGDMDYMAEDTDGAADGWSGPRLHRNRGVTPPGARRRISINQRDFRRKAATDDSGEEYDSRRRRPFRVGDGHEMEAKETKRIDRYMTIVKERPSERDQRDRIEERDGFVVASLAQATTDRSVDERYQEEMHEQDTANRSEAMLSNVLDQESSEMVGEESHEAPTYEEPPVTEEEEIALYTPAPRANSEERQDLYRLEDSWSLESSSAEVAEVRPRYKRSERDLSAVASERDIERLEDFFRNNAKLQQKFAEMFDLMLEAIEELDSDENDASERIDGSASDEKHEPRRTKRNVLLHPQSWEARERSNMIQRKASSLESRENYVEPPVAPRAEARPSVTTEADHEHEHYDETTDEGRPGAYVIRTVVNFMRKATSDFHQLFSGWFGKPTS
ncbi:uncharacterized protein LOC131207133 [Anopheles bellator]|uniref:uncharacterized protein LOC131207133 n=1 Tax=Anopheles bellator TaxID=139047 RepID=UPI00264717AD|nr:uncharacterized protein LOC131207133 [Anopheles bellator]